MTTVTMPTGSILSGAGRPTNLQQIPGTAAPILTQSSTGSDHLELQNVRLTAYTNSSNTGGVLWTGVSRSRMTNVIVEGYNTYGIKIIGFGAANTGDAMYNELLSVDVRNGALNSACIQVSCAAGATKSHPDGTRIIGGYLGMQVAGTGILFEGPTVDAAASICADGIYIAGVNMQNITIPFDLTCRFAQITGCRVEHTGANMDAYVRAGTTNSPSRDIMFIANEFASGTLTFHDSGQRTWRIGDTDASGAIQSLFNLFSGGTTLGVRVDADTADRFRVRSDGQLPWGDGTTANLSALGVISGQETVLRTVNEFNFLKGASTDDTFSGNVSGDATSRYRITAAGRIKWGDGTNAVDTFLKRLSANVVASEGGIAVADGMTAPAAVSGSAIIYVDGTTGDLRVIFGDGTDKLIVAD